MAWPGGERESGRAGSLRVVLVVPSRVVGLGRVGGDAVRPPSPRRSGFRHTRRSRPKKIFAEGLDRFREPIRAMRLTCRKDRA